MGFGYLMLFWRINFSFPVPVLHEVAAAAVSPSPGLIKPTPTSTLLATSQSNVPPLIPNSGVLLQVKEQMKFVFIFSI